MVISGHSKRFTSPQPPPVCNIHPDDEKTLQMRWWECHLYSTSALSDPNKKQQNIVITTITSAEEKMQHSLLKNVLLKCICLKQITFQPLSRPSFSHLFFKSECCTFSSTEMIHLFSKQILTNNNINHNNEK